MVAVGTDRTAAAGQSLAHGQKLDGNAEAVLIETTGGHVFDITGQDKAAIGLVYW